MTSLPGSPTQRLVDVVCGANVIIRDFVNLYGCSIGDGTQIAAFVEVQRGVTIGARCKISSHSFICEGVVIEDEVFVGHSVAFTNDRYPRATTAAGKPKQGADWTVIPTVVRTRAAIGTGATILPGVEIGEGAIVGAGSVVTRSVAARTIVAGNPARVVRSVRDDE